MAAITLDTDLIPSNLPPAPPRRPRVLLVGTALVIGSVAMMFLGLIGIYIATRHGVVHGAHGVKGVWIPKAAEIVNGKPVDAHIPLTPGNMAAFTLLLSVITMQWAVYSVGNNDRQNAAFAMLLTMLFGIAVITSTSFLYTQMHLPVASTPGLLIYVITGAHLAMLAVGMVFAAVMTFRTLGGEYSGRDREGLVAASLFWYATVAIYMVIWYAIYVIK